MPLKHAIYTQARAASTQGMGNLQHRSDNCLKKITTTISSHSTVIPGNVRSKNPRVRIYSFCSLAKYFLLAI